MDFHKPIRLFKNIWWFLSINFVWGTASSLYYNRNAFLSAEDFWMGAILGFCISTTYIYGFILIWFELDKKYSWIQHTWKRVFFGLLYGAIHSVLSIAVIVFIGGLFISNGNIEFSINMMANSWIYPLSQFFPSALVVCAVAFFKNWSQSVLNREKLQTEMMTYKFESLQNQLNPHFLFNSFNVLSNLVYDDQKLAIQFVDQLSEMYNYVLDSKNENLVPLKEELAFVDSYCFLLKTRFEEKLVIEINVQPSEDSWVAPMVLQLLIENAVKHNAVTKQKPLQININQTNDYLVVTNVLSPKTVIDSSTKTGLKNIKQRYAYFTDQPILIDSTEKEFKVSVPIIQKKYSKMILKKLPMKVIIGPFGTIGKRIAFNLSLGLPIVLLIHIFLKDVFWGNYFKTLCLYVTNDFIFTLGHMYIFYNLDENYDWLKNTIRRFILGVVFHTLFSALAFLLIQLALMKILYGMTGYETFIWFADIWYFPVGLTALIIVFTTTLGFFDKWKKSLIEEGQMRTEMMSYKFDSLKSQVNPAFLFENFRSLKRLIKSDQKKAVGIIQKMSQLYRSVLETKDMELISLESELQLLDLYVDLLKLRYDNTLVVNIDVKAESDDSVVPVAIQNVIELLLTVTETEQSTQQLITLNRKEQYLVITLLSYGLSELNEIDERSIQNLRQRYGFFTDLKIQIESNENSISISIPILKEE